MEKQITAGLKYTFLAHGIVMTMFTVTYVFFPVQYGDLTGCISKQVPDVFRLLGTIIFGYAINSFLAFRETSWEKVKIVAQMNCLMNILIPFAILIVLLFCNFPSIAWMAFTVTGGFGIAFNFFYFKK